MSAIPPNWLGSIIQSQGAHERAGQAKATEEAKGTQRADFTDQLRDIIENNDHDAEVYSDAEGAGSRGSPFSEPEEEPQNPSEEDDATEAGESGLDLQA